MSKGQLIESIKQQYEQLVNKIKKIETKCIRKYAQNKKYVKSKLITLKSIMNPLNSYYHNQTDSATFKAQITII